MASLGALTCVIVSIFVFCGGVPVPKYNDTYFIRGTIRLPYAQIVEPFVALMDAPNKRSRIIYYNGTFSSIQRGAGSSGYKYGVNQEIVYYSDQKVLNKQRCFESNGTAASSVSLMTVMPDLTGFKFVGNKVMSGVNTNMFQLVNTVGKKISTYTFYTMAANNTPMMYEMMGYDSLIGSHYDKYFVDYLIFSSPHTFSDADFIVPGGLKCGSFPGPGQKSLHQVDPMLEFVHGKTKHVDDAFEDFKKTHGKSYKPFDHEVRKGYFRQNLRFIHSKNRAGLPYKLKVNHLADLSDKEMKLRNGFHVSKGNHGGAPFDLKKAIKLPSSFDWRIQGAVTPVKDQAICGSCWSFGTTGTIEGAYFVKTGNLVRLSQQELMDCSWGFGNNACDGGEDFRAYQFVMANGGLTSEDQYGQYLGADGKCKKDSVKNVVQLQNYTLLPPGDEDALLAAIFSKGPISVAIDASHKSLSFYSNGVYYEPKCKNGPDDLDHAVLAVGYGELRGEPYWLIKNSWSTYWGNDGYVLMSRKNNNCGVATAASYPILK